MTHKDPKEGLGPLIESKLREQSLLKALRANRAAHRSRVGQSAQDNHGLAEDEAKRERADFRRWASDDIHDIRTERDRQGLLRAKDRKPPPPPPRWVKTTKATSVPIVPGKKGETSSSRKTRLLAKVRVRRVDGHVQRYLKLR